MKGKKKYKSSTWVAEEDRVPNDEQDEEEAALKSQLAETLKLGRELKTKLEKMVQTKHDLLLEKEQRVLASVGNDESMIAFIKLAVDMLITKEVKSRLPPGIDLIKKGQEKAVKETQDIAKETQDMTQLVTVNETAEEVRSCGWVNMPR